MTLTLATLPHERPVGRAKPSKRSAGGGKNKKGGVTGVRYRDGMVVQAKDTQGGKYLVEQKEEWDGGSKGKVITKGKRGKGYV